MNLIRKIFVTDNLGALSLGILAFEGFGNRLLYSFIPSPIIWWLVVLIAINIKFLLKTNIFYWTKTISLFLFYFFFNYIKGIEPPVFIYAAWMSAIVVLARYIDSSCSFIDDLRKLSRFCMWYHLLHVPFILFAKSFPVVETGMTYYSLFFLWYMPSDEGLCRICGFAWEPSCWNIFLDFNLIFTLYYKESKWMFFISIFALLVTDSTTAFVVMVFILCGYYFLMTEKRTIVRNLFFGTTLLFFLVPFVLENFNNKMNTGSGQARGGDFVVAKAVLERNPLLGTDLANVSKLSYVILERDRYWTAGTDGNRDMVAGITNGFAGLFVEWGGLFGLMFIFLPLFSNLIVEKKLRFFICCAFYLVLMGTPIARTGFFFMFPFSYIFINKYARNKNINNYCDL